LHVCCSTCGGVSSLCCSVLCSVRFPNSVTAEKVCASVARVLQYALQYALQYVWRCVFCVLQCVVQCAVPERLLNSDTAENTHIHTCTHTNQHIQTLSHTHAPSDTLRFDKKWQPSVRKLIHCLVIFGKRRLVVMPRKTLTTQPESK